MLNVLINCNNGMGRTIVVVLSV